METRDLDDERHRFAVSLPEPTTPSVAWVIVLAIASFAVASRLVREFRVWALRQEILDVANHRSLHTGTVPRGAGVAIVALTVVGVVGLSAFTTVASTRILWAYIAGGVLIAAVSWVDDVRGLPAFVRFPAHLIGAAAVVTACGGVHVVALPAIGTVDIGVVGTVFAVIWIVGLTNAFNFMDGSDGIAGLQAVVAGAGLAVIGFIAHEPLLVVVPALIAGSSAGFLRSNWAPANVFMGDVGSAFVGYSFASVSLIAASSSPRLAAAGVMAVWPFVFDTAFTLLQRMRRGERIWEAHRSHLYQRSIAHGAGHAPVAIEYAMAAAATVAAAILWVAGIDERGVAVLVLAAAVAVWLWMRMTRRERGNMQVAPHA
jgi:UDP-N-acetylmuramyl pentapeptide phosphotransferase/UDP-N-acetylglucosamine-1-phosphate transferase